ncbi:MAG: diguanylate cyclase domain-containing protein, partial [Acidimicrobiales bacterium]
MGTVTTSGPIDSKSASAIDGAAVLAPQVHPDDRAGLLAAHQDVAARPGGSATVTVRVRDGAGGWRSSEVTVANQLDDPAVSSVVMWIRSPDPDPALVFRAGHDSLTALANRDTLLGRLDAALSDAGRCAVLYLDLDGFKVVNDTLGHAAGDHLLVVTAERLRQVVRPGDTVGRLGGDEFVIVAVGVDRASDALGLAERVRA